MISKIKILIQKIIKKSGYKIRGVKKIVKHNDFDAIIKFLWKQSINEKKIIFDVGANLGQSIERFKKISNYSEVHSFEPTPDLFNKLSKNYSKTSGVKLNKLALGDKVGESSFNSYKYHKINSIIDIDDKSKFAKSRKIVSESNDQNFTEIINVKVGTVDDYCKRNNVNEINLLKIDTQGFEDKVLLGSIESLKNNKIDIIELELVIGFAYKKNLTFYDIEKILSGNGYKLIAIEDSGNLISFSNLQTNLIYVKNQIYEEIRELHYKNVDISDVTKSVSKNHPFSY
jgi:FkbM family methyltransferase